jgi:SAM-dependent methyltransferase
MERSRAVGFLHGPVRVRQQVKLRKAAGLGYTTEVIGKSNLTDLRILVLHGPTVGRQAETDFDLLSRHATTHILPVQSRQALLTYLRVIKRLLLRQDDLLVLYDLPALPRLIITREARLWKRAVLPIHSPTLAAPGPGREKTLLHAVARRTQRPTSAASRKPLRLDVGCGSAIRPGFVGIDARQTVATAIVADARAIPVGNQLADEVYASCLLEHFDDPHEVLKEIHRVLQAEGQAVLRLPNLGTYSSHLDTTHRFLADLALWRRILAGYFEEVQVVPVGTKYRDNRWLVRINWVLVYLLKWYELAQGWDFICRRPKAVPSVEYTGWWEE